MTTKKLFMVVVVLLLALISCEQPAGPEARPKAEPEPGPIVVQTGITVTEPPVMQTYARNQPFDPVGLVVKAVYSDGTERVLGETEYVLGAVRTDLPGVKSITVSSGTFTAQFRVVVRSSTSILSAISVTTVPSKLAYEFGEEFDMAGMIVTGTFYDSGSDGNVFEDMDLTGVRILGYDKGRRGLQSITVMANGYEHEGAFTVDVRVPSHADLGQWKTPAFLFIKGQSLSVPSNFAVTVTANGTKRAVAGIGTECFSGYNSSATGTQSLTFTLDHKTAEVSVYVMDAEPELYFDYGFMRHQGDRYGYGPNKNSWGEAENGGRYYVQPNQKLVIAPVRFLLGYKSDHTDAGVTWAWNVDGLPAGTYTVDGEFLRFTPAEAGTWNVSVTATGRHFITGENVSKTASTRIVCFTEPLPQGTLLPTGGAANLWFLRNYAPGQFTEKGTGLGWSLGAYGGYAAWKLDRDQDGITIIGNPMSTWVEPGIVWVMRDDNGNGMPDETWYELRGSDDNSNTWRPRITRRMAMKYFTLGDGGYINEYDQLIKANFCVDAKGRVREVPGGWSSRWGVEGDWVAFAGTMLRDNGIIDEGLKEVGSIAGYADTTTSGFTVLSAIYPDGTAVSPRLDSIRFVKVQTGVFKYPGGGVGEVSTEINTADTIGRLTDFPLP